MKTIALDTLRHAPERFAGHDGASPAAALARTAS